MNQTRRGFVTGVTMTLAGISCAAMASPALASPAVSPGRVADAVVIDKSKRRMHLLNASRPYKRYRIDLGFAPVGHKRFEGDGRTPEGIYVIDRRNPNSAFHLSLGISYPNEADRAFAESLGRSPGGDIFIHGGSGAGRPRDWTAGCVAVRNRQIEEIWEQVATGTPVLIRP